MLVRLHIWAMWETGNLSCNSHLMWARKSSECLVKMQKVNNCYEDYGTKTKVTVPTYKFYWNTMFCCAKICCFCPYITQLLFDDFFLSFMYQKAIIFWMQWLLLGLLLMLAACRRKACFSSNFFHLFLVEALFLLDKFSLWLWMLWGWRHFCYFLFSLLGSC